MTAHVSHLFNSEKGALLHDSHDLFLANFAITVSVSLIDHLLNLVICHIFAEFLGNALEVLEANFSGLVIIKEPEGL